MTNARAVLVQLYFAAQLPNEAIVYLLEQELEARQEKLAQCEMIASLSLSNPSASREQKLHRLVLALVKQQEQTYLDWLEKAIRAMHTLRDRNNPKLINVNSFEYIAMESQQKFKHWLRRMETERYVICASALIGLFASP